MDSLSEVEQLDESMHEFTFDTEVASLQKLAPFPELLLVKVFVHEEAQDGQFPQPPPPNPGPQAIVPVDEAKTRRDAREDFMVRFWVGKA